MELRSDQKEDREIGIMRSSLDYTSPNPDSNKLSSPIRATTRSDHHHHHQQSITNNSTIIQPVVLQVPPRHQTLDHPNPNPDPNSDPVPAAAIGPAAARYRECLKNHAASSGGHVLDGCGEFMPASADAASPDAMKCAACECHRSFHRKEIEGAADQQPPAPPRPHSNHPNYYYSRNNNNNNKAESGRLLLRSNSNSVPLLQHYDRHRPLGQPVMMAFGGAESSSDQDIRYHDDRDRRDRDDDGRAFKTASSIGKSNKRFRTKFKQDQKEKMAELAERLGWRIQKHDEQEVQRFCSEVGVKRQVFKVWMHNNKQAMKKKKKE